MPSTFIDSFSTFSENLEFYASGLILKENENYYIYAEGEKEFVVGFIDPLGNYKEEQRNYDEIKLNWTNGDGYDRINEVYERFKLKNDEM